MLHPACPAIARMSYYRSLESYGEYGACVTSPVWFAAASVLGAIAAAGMTIAGLTAARRHDPMRRRTRASVIVPAAVSTVAVAIMLLLSANPVTAAAWAAYAAIWLAYGLIGPRWRTGESPVMTLLVMQIGVLPVLVCEYTVSDEVNVSGGATIACCLGMAAYAVIRAGRTGSRDPHADRTPIYVLALFWLISSVTTYQYGGLSGITDFCPALSATDEAGLVAYCIGPGALAALNVTARILPAISLIAVAMAVRVGVRGGQRTAATVYRLLASALSAAAFVIAFTMA